MKIAFLWLKAPPLLWILRQFLRVRAIPNYTSYVKKQNLAFPRSWLMISSFLPCKSHIVNFLKSKVYSFINFFSISRFRELGLGSIMRYPEAKSIRNRSPNLQGGSEFLSCLLRLPMHLRIRVLSRKGVKVSDTLIGLLPYQ